MGYGADVFHEAETIINLRRLRAEDELEKRRELLYKDCPRAKVIEYELAGIFVQVGKRVISGIEVRKNLDELKNKSLALQEELKGILSERKLPENYLEEWYKCEECKDTGFIDGYMCKCLKNTMKQLAYDRLNQASPLKLCSFDSFKCEYYSDTPLKGTGKVPRKNMESVLRFCVKYADNFSEGSRSLLFQGGPGLGKTHLSLAIAGTVIEKGYGVIYVSSPDIFTRLENERFRGGFEEKGSTDALLCECDLLILDDMGTEYLSKFTSSELYNILNSRLLRQKPTIISTNLTLDEMQQMYGTRIVSRIIGMLDRVEFIGTDIRQVRRINKN